MVQVNSLKTKDKLKKTEIGKIPVDWEVCRLGEYAYIKARIGWRGLSSSEYTDKGPLLIAGKHIHGTKILWDKCDHISKFRYEEFSEIKLQKNDIIISKDGTIGRLGFIDKLPQQATIGGTMMLIRPNKKDFYSKFVYYYFQSSYFQNIIKSKVSGTSIPHIFQRDIVNLLIPMIPFKEQERITEILSSIDEAIENREQIIEKIKKLKTGLMQNLLTGKVRLKGFTDKWKFVTLGEVAQFRRGSFPQPYGLDKWYDDENGEPFVQVYDVDFSMKLKSHTKRKISKEAAKLSVFVKKGSVVLTIQGLIGRIAITQYDSYVDRTLLIFTKFMLPVNKVFFVHVVFELFEREKQRAQGSTIKTITKEKLSNFKLKLPSLQEQQKIATVLSATDEEIQILQTQKETLSAQKRGLMQQLLTGKIRVNVK